MKYANLTLILLLISLYVPSEVMSNPEVKLRMDSSYNGKIIVLDNNDLRVLLTQNSFQAYQQSTISLNNPGRLIDNYTQIMSIATALHPNPQKLMNIGLGAGVLPRFHLQKYNASQVTSIEIDPKMIQVARQYFMVEDARHKIIEGDGSEKIVTEPGLWDIIWVDAFTPNERIPKVFRESEFIMNAQNKLRSGGMLIVNVWERTYESLMKLAKLYQKGFRSGIIVTIPMASNRILVVGDDRGITCEGFWEVYKNWKQAGIVNVQWSKKENQKAFFDRSCQRILG